MTQSSRVRPLQLGDRVAVRGVIDGAETRRVGVVVAIDQVCVDIGDGFVRAFDIANVARVTG